MPEPAEPAARPPSRNGSAPGAQRMDPVAPPSPGGGAGLPAPLTSFVGREQEVAAVTARLLDPGVRLLTLTGPGGVGKTRLALEAARAVGEAFPDGVVVVPLAALADPALVPAAAAQALGVRETADAPPLQALQAALRGARLLLVLDNFEHLLAAAPVVPALLAACPGLTALATSRAPLRVTGEFEHPVPPLTLPDAPDSEHAPDLRALSRCGAVALFVERVAAVEPGFVLTDETAPAVAAICRRLDGLPLALELAAARAKLLPPAALLDRLDRRLGLLTGGRRDVPARQRTLRATLDWSHALLSPAEAALFRRLAVFAGGWTVAAAEAVCSGTDSPPSGVLDGMDLLVDKSLLLREGAAAEPRFAMLQTVREYALEQLAASGEAAAIRARHAAHFLALAERAGPGLLGPQAGRWLSRLDRQHDDLRAAVRWVIDRAAGGAPAGPGIPGRPDAEAAWAAERLLGLGEALHPFWAARGHVAEVRRWVDAVRPLLEVQETAGPQGAGPPGPPRPLAADACLLRVEALYAAGNLTLLVLGDAGAARPLLDAGLALARRVGSEEWIAKGLYHLGNQTFNAGDRTRARPLLEEGLALARRTGDRWTTAWALIHLSFDERDAAVARDQQEEGLALLRGVGNRWNLGLALRVVGSSALEAGDLSRARTLLEECAPMAEEAGDPRHLAWLRAAEAGVARREGDHARAVTHLEAALAHWRRVGLPQGIAGTLRQLAGLARVAGEYPRAVRLCEEALAVVQEEGDRAATAWGLHSLAEAVRLQGDRHRAARLDQESLALLAAGGLDAPRGHPLHNLGMLALDAGDGAGALARFRESLTLMGPRGPGACVALCLEGVAAVAGASGDVGQARSAARLFGAAEALREAAVAPVEPADRPGYARRRAAVRARLDATAWRTAWAAGRAMPAEQAVAAALGAPSAARGTASTSAPVPADAGIREALSRLTPREREVATLLVRGLTTNRELAAELVITPGTANLHVKRLLSKLGFRTRAQAAAWAAQHPLALAPPLR